MGEDIAEPQSGEVTLYRQEAIAGLRMRHGRPAPLFGVRVWVMVLFMTALFVVILIFLAFSTFNRKETVQGFIRPSEGSAAISLSRPGVIQRIFVREGQTVRKGQPLFAISFDSTLEGGQTLGSRLSEANATQARDLGRQLDALRDASTAQERESLEKLNGAHAQVGLLNDTLALQRQRLALQEATLVSLQALAAKGFVSTIRLRDKQADVLAARQAIYDTQRQREQNRADIQGLKATVGRGRSEAAQSIAQLNANQAMLDEKQAQAEAERSIVVVAPQDGRVATIQATHGQAIASNATLATLLPVNARLEAELWVPSRAVGLIRTGDEVHVMFDAFPFERFGIGRGRVASITTTPVDSKDLPLPEMAEAKEALFRVRVTLADQAVHAYGKSWALAPGSRLRADVILERQSLLGWILDPLHAAQGRAQ